MEYKSARYVSSVLGVDGFRVGFNLYSKYLGEYHKIIIVPILHFLK